MWKFVQDNSVKFADDVEGWELLREKDRMLATNFVTAERMEVISKEGGILTNRSQLFLQVMSVADIETGKIYKMGETEWEVMCY